jgi:hypothetical protein
VLRDDERFQRVDFLQAVGHRLNAGGTPARVVTFATPRGRIDVAVYPARVTPAP